MDSQGDTMRQLIEDLISMMEYHVEQTRPIHSTTVALQAAKEALKSLPPHRTEPLIGCVNHDCAKCKELESQEPVDLKHIDEQDCLIDVDKKAWRSLVENRGGCRCHISPPCSACSNPISEEEMNELGYTYTTPPQRTEQEPVAWMYVNTDGECEQIEYGEPFDDPSTTPLYTTPPQRTWVGLTNEEKIIMSRYDLEYAALIGEVERKLKEKNNG